MASHWIEYNNNGNQMAMNMRKRYLVFSGPTLYLSFLINF
jgi:hypothetical protein